MPVDRIQSVFAVGDIVNVPCTVVTVGGSAAEPTVTLTTKYPGFDGNTTTLADTLDAIQVIEDK